MNKVSISFRLDQNRMSYPNQGLDIYFIIFDQRYIFKSLLF